MSGGAALSGGGNWARVSGMTTYIGTYIAALVTFTVMDGLWLGVIGKGFYLEYLGYIMTDQVNWVAAAVFYLLYLAGVLHFAVWPSQSVSQAAVQGALLGGLCYATFELTALATLKDWPLGIVFIDIAWGVVLNTVVAAVAYAAWRHLAG